MAEDDWAREYFERGYGQRWGLKPPSDQVRLEAGGLSALLELSPKSRVVDIACGHGRHAIALAEQGLRIIGVDSAVALLSRARALATECRGQIHWVRGDMRRLPFRSECADAAVILDAFGFFETDDEHDAVLREAARVLRAGGRLAIKAVNGGPVVDTFRETDREERDGTVIAISRALTPDRTRMIERIHISGSRGDGEYQRRQRLYQVDELASALDRAGFSVVGVFASPDGAPFLSGASPTMWFVSQRSA